jgi:hypothetical protein
MQVKERVRKEEEAAASAENVEQLKKTLQEVEIKGNFDFYFYRDNIRQCCGPGMFIPDPSFFNSGSRIRIFFHPGSATKSLSILTQKIVSKVSEI